MAKVIMNNQLIDRADAHVDIEDRGYQFGDGIYEVIRVYDGQLFTGSEHLDRFFASAKKIKLRVPFEKAELTHLLQTLIKENKLEDGAVYAQLTRGASPRSHAFPGADVSGVFTAYTMNINDPKAARASGVDALLTEDVRWLRCDIKSLNLLPNILAKQEAAEQNCFEAILHRNGVVTEGSSTNVYIVKDGTILTHPATNLILNGITRQVIAQLCEDNHLPFLEKEFLADDLLSADEVFISSTTSEVMPVVRVNGDKVGNGNPGPVTRKLQALFSERIKEDITAKLKKN